MPQMNELSTVYDAWAELKNSFEWIIHDFYHAFDRYPRVFFNAIAAPQLHDVKNTPRTGEEA